MLDNKLEKLAQAIVAANEGDLSHETPNLHRVCVTRSKQSTNTGFPHQKYTEAHFYTLTNACSFKCRKRLGHQRPKMSRGDFIINLKALGKVLKPPQSSREGNTPPRLR